jgi:hypothetical protein
MKINTHPDGSAFEGWTTWAAAFDDRRLEDLVGTGCHQLHEGLW